MALIKSLRTPILFLSAVTIGCRNSNSSDPPTRKERIVEYCYLTKPVKNNCNDDTRKGFDFSSESLDHFLTGIIAETRLPIYDSAMDYITSFDRQEQILVNYNCFSKLNRPESGGWENLYFNTGSPAWTQKHPFVDFLRTYKKNIFDFGRANVFEYLFNNVAEVEPHFMYIILREHTEDDDHYGRDYKGIVLFSDGLDWKDYPNGYSIPLFTQMVRRSKEYYIPLHFDGDRFIPMGHFKSDNWRKEKD